MILNCAEEGDDFGDDHGDMYRVSGEGGRSQQFDCKLSSALNLMKSQASKKTTGIHVPITFCLIQLRQPAERRIDS